MILNAILNQLPEHKKDEVIIAFSECFAAIGNGVIPPPPQSNPLQIMVQFFKMVGAEIHFCASEEQAKEILAKAVANGDEVGEVTLTELIPPEAQYEAAVAAEAAMRKAAGKQN